MQRHNFVFRKITRPPKTPNWSKLTVQPNLTEFGPFKKQLARTGHLANFSLKLYIYMLIFTLIFIFKTTVDAINCLGTVRQIHIYMLIFSNKPCSGYFIYFLECYWYIFQSILISYKNKLSRCICFTQGKNYRTFDKNKFNSFE